MRNLSFDNAPVCMSVFLNREIQTYTIPACAAAFETSLKFKCSLTIKGQKGQIQVEPTNQGCHISIINHLQKI